MGNFIVKKLHIASYLFEFSFSFRLLLVYGGWMVSINRKTISNHKYENRTLPPQN